MKKLITSLAAIAALATSVMAFDVYPVNELNQYEYNGSINYTSDLRLTYVKGYGSILIYPLFYVGNGWKSQIRVINDFPVAGAAKIVFYSAKDSKELKDFNIYLSGNDEWIGEVIEENGKYYIVSTDGSSPLKGTAQNPYPMASVENPLKIEIPEGVGYVAVISMGSIATRKTRFYNWNDYYTFHNQHSKLREVYTKLANINRSVSHSENPDFTFSNGVILNKKAYLPCIAPIRFYIDSDNKKYYIYDPVYLSGDVRITNTINGTDMIYHAEAFGYDDDNYGVNLLYVEGEKANIADLAIRNYGSENEYVIKDLIDDLYLISPKTVTMTYGDTQDISRNYLVLTTPLKREIVQEAIKRNDPQYYDANKKVVYDYDYEIPIFYNVEGNTQDGVISYGEVRLIAEIYNNDESMMSAGQFSPATTPTIILRNEVSSTGTDVNDANKLPYYLKQAQENGFTKGYVYLYNLGFNKQDADYEDQIYIPGIVTQMIATDAGNAVVTNWFKPTQILIFNP